jgi:hypothetical protein
MKQRIVRDLIDVKDSRDIRVKKSLTEGEVTSREVAELLPGMDLIRCEFPLLQNVIC